MHPNNDKKKTRQEENISTSKFYCSSKPQSKNKRKRKDRQILRSC